MKACISVCHDDETLIAEISFWATSAGYDVVRHERVAVADAASGKLAAAILQLSGSSDAEIDLIESLSKATKGRVIVISALDPKTNSSVRRLFQEKAIEAVLLSRAEFGTRQLAELLKSKDKQPDLDRQALADAISNGYVIAHFQPKVPFKSEIRTYGVEALCRIQHPERGMIFPDSFIPLAEAHDLILPLTDAVTVNSFRALKSWDARGLKLRLALNISQKLMSDMAWFELFEHRCQEHQIDPSRITLEVTESSSQNGKGHVLEILSRLRLKGFMLSIDDFGTGFSSLETLYKLPFGELKIDKGFVFDLHKNAEARTLVETTISLARKLGLKIVAEGVESEELFQELRNLHCDDAQGYYISKPIASDRIPEFFEQWDAKQRSSAPANRLHIVHGLLAEILSGQDDSDDDDTIVIGATSTSPADNASEIAAKIPALVMAGDTLGALALAQRAAAIAHAGSALRSKLVNLGAELGQSVAPAAVELVRGRTVTQLLASSSVTIGRESSTTKGDIQIPCRWLSRASKNLCLSSTGTQWQITDLGSTNGHFVNGERLQPQVPFTLSAAETLVEIGKIGSDDAPAFLRFLAADDGSIEVIFGVNGDPDESGAIGATGRSWLIFDRELRVGRDREAGFAIPEATAGVVADISMRDGGLWITPRPGQSVELGGHEFTQSAPMALGCGLHLGCATWTIAAAGTTLLVDEPAQLASAFA